MLKVGYFKVLSQLEKLKKTMKNSVSIASPNQDLSLRPPEFKAGVLTTTPQYPLPYKMIYTNTPSLNLYT